VKYRLIYTRRALRDIDGLDDLTKKRIAKTLARYEGDPLKHGRTQGRSGNVETSTDYFLEGAGWQHFKSGPQISPKGVG
jgi:hypothetical protein